MPRSRLRELLEDGTGWVDFQLVIPHPFLPPRYKKLSKERNMILLFDERHTLHVRWEGARAFQHHPLTPREAGRMLSDVLERMKVYRRELKVFGKFVADWAEGPEESPRKGIGYDQEQIAGATLKDEGGTKPVETLVGAINELEIALSNSEQGGESPMGLEVELDG